MNAGHGSALRGGAGRRPPLAVALQIVALLSLLPACSTPGTPPPDTGFGAIAASGTLRIAGIREASGLARSYLRDDRLWTMNDGGSPPDLFAIGQDGASHGSIRLQDAPNVDWEDLASFELDGRAWLLIADIGDNMQRRHQVTLYIVAEPALSGGTSRSLSPAWQISFVYPDGPLDAEAVAVDTANERVLVLSKRTIPARLYELPLRPSQTGSVVTARRIATLGSLPQPSARDLQRALPQQSWHWQPTGMDLAADNRAAAILTYRAVYYYARSAAQSWSQALQAPPLRLDLGGKRHAESVAISRDGNTVFITVEGRNPPLLRFDRQPPTDLPRPPQ